MALGSSSSLGIFRALRNSSVMTSELGSSPPSWAAKRSATAVCLAPLRTRKGQVEDRYSHPAHRLLPVTVQEMEITLRPSNRFAIDSFVAELLSRRLALALR